MIKGGPRIITDGLVLCLDAHDAKSYAGEPTTNVLQYPESINTGPTKESWSGTITENAVTAPDGTVTATKIEATSGYVYERLYINTSYNGVSFGVGDTITYSVWIKMLDGTQTTSNGPYIWNYNSPTYGIVARDLSGLGPDWKLYKMTYTIQSHQTNFSISYSASNGGVTGTYAIWHPQLEVKSYNTSYVETSRSATNGWVDRSGNSNSGTLTNMIGTGASHYRDGQVIMPVANSYLDFDASDDRVAIGSIGSMTAFTVELWINPDAVQDYQNPIDCNYSYNGTTGNIGPRLELRTGASPNWIISGDTGNNNNYYYIVARSGAPSAGTWYHAALTYDGSGNASGVKSYWNGSLVTSGATNVNTPSAVWVNTMNNVQLGLGFHLGSSRHFNGQISTTKIYNKALTAAEVLSNYNATKGRFS